MKKLVLPLMIVALLVALFAATVQADMAVVAKLIAGQNTHVGWVRVSQIDENTLKVKYRMFPFPGATEPDGFCLLETHLHVGDDPGDIPQVNGNPIPGQFAYGDDDLGCVDRVSYEVDISGMTLPVAVAAHAVVGMVDDPCDPYVDPYCEPYNETGWTMMCGHLDRYAFPGSNWATYIWYPGLGGS